MRTLTIFAAMLVAAVAAAQKPKVLNVDVDVVQVFATVTDMMGHYIVGLEKDHFEVTEDKVKQKIDTFSTEDVPMSVGLIFDVSGSMKGDLTLAKNAAVTFLKMGNPEDEYFLVEFSDRAKVTVDFTTDINKLQNHLVFLPAKGRTAMSDALYLGLQKVKEGTNLRKFLLLITDGGDNHSRYSPEEVKQFAMETDAQIYTIRMVEGGPNYGSGPSFDLVDPGNYTGGRTFRVRGVEELEDVCSKIAIEVKNQYVLTYKSTNENRDGKFRKIRMKLNPPPGVTNLNVRAKDGYYAPTR